MQPIFTIELHERDIFLLERIRTALGVEGKIYRPRKGLIQYRVTSLNELQVIANHLDKYSLISKKRSDYELFKLALNLIGNKEHLTFEGLNKIISIRSSLNLGLTNDLKIAFPSVTPYSKLNN